MSKPYFAPFRVSDFAASQLLYVRESLIQKAHVEARLLYQRDLKRARDARYRERKRASKQAVAQA